MQARSTSPKTKITRVVSMGDSLGDRGTFYKHRTLFGIIPLRYITGLSEISPQGRFTNGYTWNDSFGAMLASMFIAKEYEKTSPCSAAAAPARSRSASDLADAIIADDFAVVSTVEKAYSLDNDKVIQYKNGDFLRSYEEAGLTAHDYSDEPISTKIIDRETVSTLAAKRALLVQDDKERNTSQEEKDQTLVTELSGGNDLITVNTRPSKEIVDKAIAARMKNVKELISKGYQHFALINLPDLSLTPRIQALSTEEQQNVHACVNYFNEQLKQAIEMLQAENSAVSIDLFDLASLFDDIMQNPEKYELDKDKQKQAFTTSSDFNMANGISHAPGYTFWDDLHPTMHVHAIFSEKFYVQFSQTYDIKAPDSCITSVEQTAQTVYEIFMAEYLKILREDKSAFFGYFRSSKLLDKLKPLSFEGTKDSNFMQAICLILFHALKEGGERTQTALRNLGWMDKNNKINPFIPALAEAGRRIDYDINVSTASTHSRALR